jgi:hypothetical protein
MEMRPIPLLTSPVPLWDVGVFHEVDREALWSALGTPHHIETDGMRTYGREEDTWGFELSGGVFLFIELRVPYREAAIVSNQERFTAQLEAASRVIPGRLEAYAQGYPRR